MRVLTLAAAFLRALVAVFTIAFTLQVLGQQTGFPDACRLCALVAAG
jgi:hypothetical protein